MINELLPINLNNEILSIIKYHSKLVSKFKKINDFIDQLAELNSDLLTTSTEKKIYRYLFHNSDCNSSVYYKNTIKKLYINYIDEWDRNTSNYTIHSYIPDLLSRIYNVHFNIAEKFCITIKNIANIFNNYNSISIYLNIPSDLILPLESLNIDNLTKSDITNIKKVLNTKHLFFVKMLIFCLIDYEHFWKTEPYFIHKLDDYYLLLKYIDCYYLKVIFYY